MIKVKEMYISKSGNLVLQDVDGRWWQQERMSLDLENFFEVEKNEIV